MTISWSVTTLLAGSVFELAVQTAGSNMLGVISVGEGGVSVVISTTISSLGHWT